MPSEPWRQHARALALVWSLALSVRGARGDGPLPQYAADRHVGVRECRSTLCHNSVTPWHGSRVRLNEYRIWRDRDHHSRAFTALQTDLGKRIGRNLRIPDATRTAECLDCHTDNVALEGRGEGYNVTDGVGCEACHGGAARWLESHQKAPRKEDEDRGMYPTWDPRARAELCLSCHLGSSTKIVTHRMLAAGHPRLSFEVDTFAQLQPPHWVASKDHVERTGEAVSHVQAWAIGQAVALREYLGLLADPRWSRDRWHEPVFFDCNSCHHRFGKQALAGKSDGTRIGLPGLAAAPFVLYEKVLAVTQPSEAAGINAELAALNRSIAMRSSDVGARATAFRQHVTRSIELVERAKLDDKSILAALAECNRPRSPLTYLVAEQLTMGVQATLADMYGDEAVNRDADVQGLLAATQSLGSFDPAKFRSALHAVCEHHL